MDSTKIDRAGSNLGRKVRVVAKIRPDSNSGSVEWVSVNRENSEDVTVSFGEQSSSRYLVDYCYKEHEDNEIIYSREVKPLISAVFEGYNSTVIAHGARGSGKTHVIQGSIEKPGLAVLATSDILSMAEENGKSIAVSFYEVDHHDHAVDLLNPERPPILVLEDRGRIQFKGLSQIPVKSTAEFQNLYFSAYSAHKAAPKKGFGAHRSHMGLIVHVISQNESVDGFGSKMNFVDMAGYEDARRKSSDGSGLAETNKINKSIYALLNVCHTLSTDESRVPYRESKLTRMLQDSLRGTGKILLVSCLNPSFCQDTIYMVSLASRSCQWIHQTPLDSMKKNASSARQNVTSHKNEIRKTPLDSTKKHASSARHSVTSHKNEIRQTALDSTKKSESSARQKLTSHKNGIPKTPLDSMKKSESSARQKVTSHKNQIPKSVSVTAKKLPGSRSHTYEKKSAIAMKSAIKGRKLFDEASLSAAKPEKETSIANVTKASEPLLVIDQLVYQMRDNSLYEAGNHAQNSRIEKENSLPDASYNVKLNMMKENDDSSLNASSEMELDPIVEKSIFEDKEEDLQEKHTPCASNYSKALSTVDEGHDLNEDNNNLMANGDGSPSISSQLRDLQSLCSSTPLCKQIPETGCISLDDKISTEIVEPRTPLMEQNMCSIERRDVMNAISSQLRDLQSLCSSTPLYKQIPETGCVSLDDKISTEIVEPRTPLMEQNMCSIERRDVMNPKSPWETFSMRSSGMKNSLVQEYLRFLNTAEKEELKKLKGIGEKRATFILELREESPEPFKSLDDLKDIGLSAKQIKGMMKKEVGELFN